MCFSEFLVRLPHTCCYSAEAHIKPHFSAWIRSWGYSLSGGCDACEGWWGVFNNKASWGPCTPKFSISHLSAGLRGLGFGEGRVGGKKNLAAVWAPFPCWVLQPMLSSVLLQLNVLLLPSPSLGHLTQQQTASRHDGGFCSITWPRATYHSACWLRSSVLCLSVILVTMCHIPQQFFLTLRQMLL